MSQAARNAAVAVLEPRPSLRAHFTRVLEAAGFRVTDVDVADAAVVAADGPGAADVPAALPVVALWIDEAAAKAHAAPLSLLRPFTPELLVRRVEDALANTFRGATAPMAPSAVEAMRSAERTAALPVSALAAAISAEVPAWAALESDERAQAVQGLLNRQAVG
jgi:hypothetical protein